METDRQESDNKMEYTSNNETEDEDVSQYTDTSDLEPLTDDA